MRESIFDYEYFSEIKAKMARRIMVETFAEPMYAKYLKIGLVVMYLQERVKWKQGREPGLLRSGNNNNNNKQL